MPKKLDDYLQEGIYGTKEINPKEKHLFLGTFRERIEIALTIGQVMQPTPYREVEAVLQHQKNIKMHLNGEIAYNHLSKYIKLATVHNIPFTNVQNLEGGTPIGLVLAYDKAIDKPEIFIKDSIFQKEMEA
ncbi:MAG: YueI family protein [Ectobacillus sp.]